MRLHLYALSLALPLAACGKASADVTNPTPPVATATPATTATPESGATTLDALLADPAKANGMQVHVKGVLTVGFEATHLDGKAWIQVAKYEGFPENWRSGPRASGRALVEAWGTIKTEKGRYGHLGKYPALFEADRVVYLGPAPEPAK